MNSEQIRKIRVVGWDQLEGLADKETIAVEIVMRGQSTAILREIAYQLAVMNEKMPTIEQKMIIAMHSSELQKEQDHE